MKEKEIMLTYLASIGGNVALAGIDLPRPIRAFFKKNVHLFLYVYLERSSCQSVVCTHYASTTIINDLLPPLRPSVHDVYTVM